MEFTERRYSVLLVSSSPKFNESMLALLPESRFLSGHRCIRRFQCPAAPSRKQIRHSHNQRPATRRFRHPPCPLHMRKQRRRGSSFCKGGALSRYKRPGIPFWRAGAAEARLLADGVPIVAAPLRHKGTSAAHGTKNRLHRGKDGGDTHNKPREAAAYGAAEDDGKGGAPLH